MLQRFKHFVIDNNQKDANIIAKQMVNAGRFDEFWEICLSILVEYVHVLSPKLPVIFYQNYERFCKIAKTKMLHHDVITSAEMQPIITNIVHELCTACKQHLSIYIHQSYSVHKKTDSSYNTIRHLLLSLDKILKNIVDRRKTTNKMSQKEMMLLHGTIGQIFSIDCDSISNIDKQNNDLQIYTHTNSHIHQRIISKVWSLLLHHAKQLPMDTYWNIVALHRLFTYGLMHRTCRHLLIIIVALEYYTKQINYEFIPKLTAVQTPPCPISSLRQGEEKQYHKMPKYTFPDGTDKSDDAITTLSDNVKSDVFHMHKVTRAAAAAAKCPETRKEKNNSRSTNVKWQFTPFIGKTTKMCGAAVEGKQKLIQFKDDSVPFQQTRRDSKIHIKKLK